MILQIKTMVVASVDNAIKTLGHPGPTTDSDPEALRAGLYAMPARTAQQLKEELKPNVSDDTHTVFAL